MKELISKLTYWKMAALRVGLYSLIVGVSDFLTDTETWSQETWDATGLFLKSRMFLGNGVAMATVIVAFLDTTMSALRNGQNGHKPEPETKGT